MPPTRPRRRCSVWPCPNNATTGGKCKTHRTKTDNARHRGTIYTTQRWRRLRKRVLDAEPYCRDGCGQPATDVDHILAIEDGGDPWDVHNLQPLAHECHARKTRARQLRQEG